MSLHLQKEKDKLIFVDCEIKNLVQELSNRLTESESLNACVKCICTDVKSAESSLMHNNECCNKEGCLNNNLYGSIKDSSNFLMPTNVRIELNQYKSSVENSIFKCLNGTEDYSSNRLMTHNHIVMSKQNKCKFHSAELHMDKNNLNGNDITVEKVPCLIDKKDENVTEIMSQNEVCSKDDLEPHKLLPSGDLDHSYPEGVESHQHAWQRRDSFSSCSSDSAVYCSSKHTLLKTSLSAVSKEASLWECGLSEASTQNINRERHSSSSSLISVVSDVSCKDNSKHTAVSSNDLNCTVTLRETTVLRESTGDKGPVPSLLETLQNQSSTKKSTSVTNCHAILQKGLTGRTNKSHRCSPPPHLLSLQQLSLHNLRKNIKYKIACSHDQCKDHSTLSLNGSKSLLAKPDSPKKSLAESKVSFCTINDANTPKKPKRKSEIDKLYDSLKEIPWARKFSPESMLVQNDVRRYSSRISGYYKLVQSKCGSKGVIPSASLYKRTLPSRRVHKRESDRSKKPQISVKKNVLKVQVSNKFQNSSEYSKHKSRSAASDKESILPLKINAKNDSLKKCDISLPINQSLPQTNIQKKQNDITAGKQILKKYIKSKPIVKFKSSLKPSCSKKESCNVENNKLTIVKEHVQRTNSSKHATLCKETITDDMMQDDLQPPILYPECTTSNYLKQGSNDTTVYYSKSGYSFNRHKVGGIWTSSSRGFYVFAEKEQEKMCDSITLISSEQRQTVTSGSTGETSRTVVWSNLPETSSLLSWKTQQNSLKGHNEIKQLVQFNSFGRNYSAPTKRPKCDEETLGSKSYHGFTFHYKGITVRKNENYTQVVLKLSNNKNIFLTVEAMTELKETLLSAVNDPSCQMLILNGSGNTFCSGLDLRPLIGPRKKEAADEMATAVKELVEALAAFRKPLVAAVNGCAMGLGVTLLTYSDVVLASNSATFQTPYAQLGYMPEGAGTLTLPQVIGATVATDMFLRGHKLTAHQAQSHGLVSEVLDDSQLFDQVLPRVQALAEHPSHIMEATKAMMRWHLWDKLHIALENEVQILPKQWLSPTCQQAITEAFENGILID